MVNPMPLVADGDVCGTIDGRDSVRAPVPRLRVSYVTMAFPVPPETFATNDVRALRSSGVEIDVHCLRAHRSDVDSLLKDRGLHGLHVDANGVLPSLRGILAAIARPLTALAAIRWIAGHRGGRGPRNDVLAGFLLLPRAFDILAALERRPPDVVHMFWGHYPAIVGRLVHHRLPHVATSISVNAYDLEWEYPGTPDVAVAAHVVRTHAKANLERLVPFLGIKRDRIEVIYNGVDVERLDSLRSSTPRSPFGIVAIGRLVESKGMAEVVRAFAIVRHRHPQATLDVLGEGPQRRELEGLAQRLGVSDAVRFHGHVPHDDAVRAMWRARVAMLLTRASGERLPNVIKEGMACGCVCITTPTPGIEELVADTVTGFVVPASNPEAAANVVLRAFAGQIDVEAMTQRAAAHVRAHFDLAATTARYRALWTNAVARIDRAQRPHTA